MPVRGSPKVNISFPGDIEILDGVELDSVACPAESEREKSPTTKSVVAPVAVYTSSEKVTTISLLSAANIVSVMIGGVTSNTSRKRSSIAQ